MSNMESLLNDIHPDVAYFRQEHISLVLSRALAETYKSQPRKPIEYFAKYLLNCSRTEKKNQQAKERLKVAADLVDKHKYFKMANEAEKEEERQEVRQKQAKVTQFYEKITVSDDLVDNLQQLVDLVHEQTHATGVYFGKLQVPTKAIKDEDDDLAHLEDDQAKIIHFTHACKGHDFMVGENLLPSEGVSHNVFIPDEPLAADDDAKDEDDNENQEETVVKKVEDDILNRKHVFVKEVVRDSRMKFYQVPRLGCFMAIPIVFKSCQNEGSLDTAVADYIDVMKRREEQEKAKQEFEIEQDRLREEKEKEGVEFEPEVREWEAIEMRPFDIVEEQYVICIDTLGQDREFTDDEKRFALQTAKNYIETWEECEKTNLIKDRDLRIKVLDLDKDYSETELSGLNDTDENKLTDENQVPDYEDDEAKEIDQKREKLKHLGKSFRQDEYWAKGLENLKEYKVIKYPRVIQSVFYWLGYTREQVCEVGTNKLFWKIAKNKVSTMFASRIFAYNPCGPKDFDYKKYQTLNFIEHNIASISLEDVETYNLTLARLLKWLRLAIEIRKQDITRRKALNQQKREKKEQLIQNEEDRKQQRETQKEQAFNQFEEDHQEEIQAYEKFIAEQEGTGAAQETNPDEEEDHPIEQSQKEPPVRPVFNAEEWLKDWEEAHPEIIIPDEVVEDIDRDWELTEEDIEGLIRDFKAKTQV